MVRRSSANGRAIGAGLLLLAGGAFGVLGCGPAKVEEPRALAAPPELDTGAMSPPFREAYARAHGAVLGNPSSGEAWGALGSLLDAHLHYEKALTCYERAHTLAPDDFRWIYLPAVVQDFLGRDLETVDRAFRAAVEREPDYPPLHYRYAEALVRQGATDRGLEAYRRALELDGDFALAHRGLGQGLLAAGDLDGAIDHLEQARRLTPGDSVVHAALARAYHQAGDSEASQRSSARARETHPVLSVPDPLRYAVDQLSLEPAYLTRRASERMDSGEFAAAERDLATLERIAPKEPQHPLRRGRCLQALGRTDAARDSYQRAAELGDATGSAHAALADLAQAAGNLALALNHRRAAVAARPSHAPYHNLLGLALAMSGEHDAALEEFAFCVSLAPPTSEVHHNWGTTLLQQGRHEEAEVHFLAALQLEPNSAGTHFNLGSIYEATGRLEQALEHFQRAAEVDPGGPATGRLRALRGKPR